VSVEESDDQKLLRLLLLESSLARYWLIQSFVRPDQKRAIRARLAYFEAEIRKLRKEEAGSKRVASGESFGAAGKVITDCCGALA